MEQTIVGCENLSPEPEVSLADVITQGVSDCGDVGLSDWCLRDLNSKDVLRILYL